MCNYDKTSESFFPPATMSVIMQINENVNARTSVQNESHFRYTVVSDGASSTKKSAKKLCESVGETERKGGARDSSGKNRIWFKILINSFALPILHSCC